MKKILKLNWIKGIIFVLLVTIITLKCCQNVFASSTQSYYYGDFCNKYTNVSASAVTEYYLPSDYYVYSVDVQGQQYLCIAYDPNKVNDSLGCYRKKIQYDLNGNITSVTASEYMQLLYGSNCSATIDGNQFQIRNMVITPGVITDVPYFQYTSYYGLGGVTDPRVLAVVSGFYAYYYGVQNYRSGGCIDGTIEVDTSNLETLVTDIGYINYDTQQIVSDIKAGVDDIRTNSGSGAPSAEIIEFMKRYDIWLLLIMFAVCISLIRQILHQVSRNIRGL